MGFAQGTMTSANASADIRAVIHGLLLAEGWQLIETLTPSGVFRNSIYKSPGTSNACGYDWYLVFAWQQTGTEQVTSILGASAYDPATKYVTGLVGARLGALGGDRVANAADGHFSETTFAAASQTADASGFFTGFKPAGVNNGQNAVSGIQTLLPSSAFAYWCSVTLDHVAFFTTVAAGTRSEGIVSSMILDPGYKGLAASFDQRPLMVWSNDPMFSSSGGLKGVDNPTANNYIASTLSYSGDFGPELPRINGTYFSASAWKPYTWMSGASGAKSSGPAWDGTDLAGGLLVGQAPDWYMVHGGSLGDTVTIDGAVYVLCPRLGAPTIAVLVK